MAEDKKSGIYSELKRYEILTGLVCICQADPSEEISSEFEVGCRYRFDLMGLGITKYVKVYSEGSSDSFEICSTAIFNKYFKPVEVNNVENTDPMEKDS